MLVSTATDAPDAVIVTAPAGVFFFLARATPTLSETFGNAQLVYTCETSCAVYMVCVPGPIVFASVVSKLFELNDGRPRLGLWLVCRRGVISLAGASNHLAERLVRGRLKLWSGAQQPRRPSTAGA